MASAAEPEHDIVLPDALAQEEEDPFGNDSNEVSSTSSVRSSIYTHIYENGRRYHSYRAGLYLLPDDEEEQDRLDYSHHLFTLSLKGAYCATKLINPHMILDVGTGTGIWAIDMGDFYPSAVVIGTDLSPIQPRWVPPNVHFQIDNATEDWTFPENHFDFIHVRTMAAGIRDWPRFLAQCLRCLKPGGRIEVTECRANFFCDDGSFPEDSYTMKWLNEFFRLTSLAHLNIDHITGTPQLLDDGGFNEISVLNNIVPVGSWPKDKALKTIGKVFREQFLSGALEAYSIALFTKVGGWSEAEFQVLCAHVRQEILTNKMHIYTFCTFVTARKPKGVELPEEHQPTEGVQQHTEVHQMPAEVSHQPLESFKQQAEEEHPAAQGKSEVQQPSSEKHRELASSQVVSTSHQVLEEPKPNITPQESSKMPHEEKVTQ